MENRTLQQWLTGLDDWLDFVPDAVMVVDPGGKIVLANRQAGQMFRLSTTGGRQRCGRPGAWPGQVHGGHAQTAPPFGEAPVASLTQFREDRPLMNANQR